MVRQLVVVGGRDRCSEAEPKGDVERRSVRMQTRVAINQMRILVAWNPSAAGLKVEDTLVVTESGFDFVTGSSEWPSLKIAGRSRPDIAIR